MAYFLDFSNIFVIFIMQQTEEGENMRKAKVIGEKEPDWTKIRGLKGYRKVRGAAK